MKSGDTHVPIVPGVTIGHVHLNENSRGLVPRADEGIGSVTQAEF